MKKLVLLSLLLMISTISTLTGQITEEEVGKIAAELVQNLNNRKVKKVGVADFTFKSQANTRIGKYIADELSNLMMRKGANFDMASRKVVREALYTNSRQNTSLVNFDRLNTAQLEQDLQDVTTNEIGETKTEQGLDLALAGINTFKNIQFGKGKKLKGVDVIIHGDIEEQGDFLKLNIEAITNDKKKDLKAAAGGRILKTPELNSMLVSKNLVQNETSIPTLPSPENSIILTRPANAITYKHENISFELVGCSQVGKEVECRLNLLASERNSHLYVYWKNTRFFDANGAYEFNVSEVKLADASNTKSRVDKALIADIPMEAVLRFRDVNRPISSIAQLYIHCYVNDQDIYAKLDNIPVQR